MSHLRMPTAPVHRQAGTDAAPDNAEPTELGFEDTLPQVPASHRPAVYPPAIDTPVQPATTAQTVDIELDFDLGLDPVLPLDPIRVPAMHLGTAPDTTVPTAAALGPVGPAALQVTRPIAPLMWGARPTRRVLVISADADERMYARARFAVRRVVWLDETSTSTQAMAAMDDVRYGIALINLDSPVIDAWALARRFRAAQPHAIMVATSSTVGVLPWLALGQHWRAWQLRSRAKAEGFDAVLAKPLRGRHIMSLVDRMDQAIEAALAPAGSQGRP